jgi:simple sugar transport system ATP-binding protein
LAELMVGRKVLLRVEKEPARAKDIVLEVQNLSFVDGSGVARLKDINLELRAGEILGIAGVAGNGQSELLEILGGMRHASAGAALYKSAPLPLSGATANGRARRQMGIAHIPEDRQTAGLIMPFMAWENIAFGYHERAAYQAGATLMDNAAIQKDCAEKMAQFDIRPPDIMLPARNFSGGNQQKIVVAREMAHTPDLLLIGQPTRGVDIGAIEFIHRQIIALRDQGCAILLVSVELDEIMGLADRVAVMFDGQIMGERDAAKTDEAELGLLMAGLTKGAA